MMQFLSSKAVMPHLTENERWRAIGMLQNGSIQLNIARQFNVSCVMEHGPPQWGDQPHFQFMDGIL